jgi:putative heme iron utilization protein
MDPEVLRALRRLLTSHRVLSLAVLVDGVPEAGLLPYALRPDFGGAYVQASNLARHTRGLMPGVRVGLLVHANDTPESDPMQLPRLAVQAAVSLLARDSGAFVAASTLFVARFPAASTTLALGDFNLYELAFERGRFVEGFARAVNVGPETFAELAALA